MIHAVIKCPVCFDCYSVKRCARVIASCGHDMCEMCLTEILMNRLVPKCPQCRKRLIEDTDMLRAIRFGDECVKDIIYNERFPKSFTLSSLKRTLTGESTTDGEDDDNMTAAGSRRWQSMENASTWELITELARRLRDSIPRWKSEQVAQAMALCQGIPLLIVTIWFLSRFI